jgi:hypothetical protein
LPQFNAGSGRICFSKTWSSSLFFNAAFFASFSSLIFASFSSFQKKSNFFNTSFVTCRRRSFSWSIRRDSSYALCCSFIIAARSDRISCSAKKKNYFTLQSLRAVK